MGQTTREILDRLVAFDTVSARSNLALIDYVQDFLATRGFAITRVPDQTGEKAGLFATIGPAGAGVLLSAHSDVVPVEGQVWTRDPFRLSEEAGRLYGRGTTDMKGFLAAMLTAADSAARRDLKEPLKLSISYDEELGCLGVADMIDSLPGALGRPRACIVGEPTEMRVAIGHKGKQALFAICHGEAGHSAHAPRFQNALHLAADFITGLRGLQAQLAAEGAQDAAYDIPYSTVHVGLLNGGRSLNIVPDRAEIAFEFRHLAQDAPADLLARIEDIAAEVGQGAVEVSRGFAYPGLDVDAAAEVTRWGLALSPEAETTKVAFGTEAGFFEALGIPTIVCGPGSMAAQGHKPDEFIASADLAACDAMLARVVQELS